ncbi:MAG: hypothetical protein JST89_09965 [Cyanobacteria bacterium SZAS-4]|nr:hypothetical protein [Cyanobacteria bacterium SZAS-4]
MPSKTRKIRNARGSGIVQGVVCLMMIVIGVVLGVLLLVNTGMAAYQKEKLCFIANQSAGYATSFLPSEQGTAPPKVINFARQLMSNMGINSGDVTVNLGVPIGAQKAAQVGITAPIATLAPGAFASVMPSGLQLSDTETVPNHSYYTAYGLGILGQAGIVGGSVLFPVTKLGLVPPDDGLPAWLINQGVMIRIR